MISSDPDPLQHVADAISRNEAYEQVTVREFIWWFGARRRRDRVVATIRNALDQHQLVTMPDFQQAYIDEYIQFVKDEPPPDQSTRNVPSAIRPDQDPTYRLKRLDAANAKPAHVHPDAPLEDAVTLMMINGYSQLPVMTNPSTVKGVISWESIGKRLALGRHCEFVNECMANDHTIVPSEEPLLAAIKRIEEDEYVLVQKANGQLSGIVTSADLSRQFHRLGEPFLLIGQIENYIRMMIRPKFEVAELACSKNPQDTEREISDVADLSFGEYKRLLEKPDRWEKLGLRVDRGKFVVELDKVREIRNDVMHFDPDGIEDESLETLRAFARLLQELAELKAIGGLSAAQ